MFNSNPFFRYDGQITFINCEIDTPISQELKPLIKEILKALQFIDVLRSLHNPHDGNPLDLEFDRLLRKRISEIMIRSSILAKDQSLKYLLEAKAQSFLNEDYINASSSFTESSLPFELMIGLLPSWRFKGKPKTYAGLLALTDNSEENLTAAIDKHALEVITSINSNLGESYLNPASNLPKQITCDVLALAGDFGCYPMHIANFLPEDEGGYNNITYKTLIYRNLYVTRYLNISIPLVNELFNSNSLNQPKDKHTIWLVLSKWFRGHDIGHNYFDSLCKLLPAFNKRKRYALQETLADLFGLKLIVSYLRKEDNIDVTVVVTIYITELVRYMTRDLEIFPDSKSAWFQLGFLFEEGVLLVNDKLIEINTRKSIEKLMGLFDLLIDRVIRKDTAYIEYLYERYLEVTNKININKFNKEIFPIFENTNALILENDLQTNLSLRTMVADNDFDHKRRF